MVGGGGVEAVAVLHQVEGLVEVGPHESGIDVVALEGALDVVQLAADSTLFLLEQLEWHGSGVVGVEEAAALGLQLAASYAQGAGVFLGVGLDTVQFGEEVVGDLLAVLGAEGEGAVEVGDALFNLVDQDGAKATGVQAVAAGADEVAVDVAAPGGGVLDQQTGAAVAADGGGLEVVVVQALAFAVAP